MLIKIFVRTFSSTEDCELFESILETRWPNLLQQVKGVRFRAMKNPQTPNVSVVLWEFPDAESITVPEMITEPTGWLQPSVVVSNASKRVRRVVFFMFVFLFG